MRRQPSIAPSSPDGADVYLVLDDFAGRLGHVWPETDQERTNRESVIKDLLEGQYANPVRVVAFNTAEGWSRDVSDEIADELARHLASCEGEAKPLIESFIERHSGHHALQLPLPLRGGSLPGVPG